MKRILLILMLLSSFILTSCAPAIIEETLAPVDISDNKSYVFEVKSGEYWKLLASRLKEKDLIHTEAVLLEYVKKEGLDQKLKPGKYELKRSMSLEGIVKTLISYSTLGEGDNEVEVTIPEGYESKEIAKLLEKKGAIKSASKFLSLLETKDFDYEFLKDVDKKTYLEGFLFPSTYRFFKNSSEEIIINDLLSEFNSVYTERFKKRAKELGLTTNEVITIASIIQKEARIFKEYPKVSSVIYNRIKKGMKLQMDATVQYALSQRKEYLSYKDLEIDSPYNTYMYKGLPPAPISSVSKEAIEAALYPDKTEYLFYVIKNKGTGEHYWAKTYEEHLENIKKSEKNLENYESGQ